MVFPGYSKDKLDTFGAQHTAREICQQPDAWQDTIALANGVSRDVQDKLANFLAKPRVRVILTGAGTSAFIGGCLSPMLAEQLGVRADAIATTDLVSNPYSYFERDTPTIVVSFARSGNSPESLAAVELAAQCLNQVLQLVVTCNPDGKLYKYAQDSDQVIGVLTPPQTDDQSFAMTSSFSSMMLLTGMLLAPHAYDINSVNAVITATTNVMKQHADLLKDMADGNFKRVVYLGSGALQALAQEAALKLLELTDGDTVALHDSPLGFRHGPKTIINNNTLVVVFMSSNSYTRQYDIDLLNELRNDSEAGKVLAISSLESGVDKNIDILVDNAGGVSDHLLCLPYIVAAQIYAFHCALAVGNSPDSPSASGTVNRVVKGVKVYPYHGGLSDQKVVEACS